MGIRDVIQKLNEMQSDGVIERYALGGAVGATFYLEPVSTLDVDVFIHFRAEAESPLVNLEPIFDYLKTKGGVMKDEYIVLSGWPVQFLPAANPLELEALKEAVERDVEGIPAQVFTAEHLAAIALRTGRAKDKARLLQFIESGILGSLRFEAIIKRHHLSVLWNRFQTQFLGGSS